MAIRCTWSCCGALFALLAGILLSPKVAPPTFFDDAIEGVVDTLKPITAWAPLQAGDSSSSWTELLPARKPFCPPVYKSCEIAHSFSPLPSDIIVTTAPKTGTTFLQYMAHLIRSDADTNFTDLYDVAPWILVHPLYKGDAADVVQPGHPRVFKNHAPLAEFKGGRHIVVIRDPAAVLQSWYAFNMEKKIPFMRHNGYLHMFLRLPGLPEEALEWWFGSTWKTVIEFQRSSIGWRRSMAFGVNLLSYYVEFWHARHDPNVLLLCYEDLVADRAQWVPVIAQFMGVKVSPEFVDRVANLTSKNFMRKHANRFDGTEYVDLINRKGLSKVTWKKSSRVSKESHEKLSAISLDMLQREWVEQIAPSTGLKSYDAMRSAWQAEVAKRKLR